uniref:Uncharacterized protein n=1 Tax=Timspurckia oligopyrenoides TaxID=708627 RepID=A0A7S0ZLD6_9RHOD
MKNFGGGLKVRGAQFESERRKHKQKLNDKKQWQQSRRMKDYKQLQKALDSDGHRSQLDGIVNGKSTESESKKGGHEKKKSVYEVLKEEADKAREENEKLKSIKMKEIEMKEKQKIIVKKRRAKDARNMRKVNSKGQPIMAAQVNKILRKLKQN